MDKSTISMAIVNSFFYVYQAGYIYVSSTSARSDKKKLPQVAAETPTTNSSLSKNQSQTSFGPDWKALPTHPQDESQVAGNKDAGNIRVKSVKSRRSVCRNALNNYQRLS
jgi:hypothetical protein